MTTRRIGTATVTRIEERLGPGFEAAYMFPDWDPKILEEHGHWMIPDYFEEATGKFISSIHSWLIRTSRHTILVDTCCGNFKPRPDFPRFHMLNTPWLDRLRAAGVTPEQVDFVLCTHLHVDHVGWNTQLVDGRWVPTFPNAKYVFSRTERDHWDPARNPNVPANAAVVYQDSVLPVVAAKQEHLIEMTDRLGDNLLIEPAPGHTPGHVVLRLLDGGDEGIFIGDVMHQPIQVYRPQWSSRFCEDPTQAAASRVRVLSHCAERGCRMFPTHFGPPHVARISRRGDGFALAFDHG